MNSYVGADDAVMAEWPEGVLIEIADSTIRNLHMMQSLHEAGGPSPYDVIKMKVDRNERREAMHGRKF